ncbi:MAG: TonB-dependent receptor, partial [Rhodocyclaceae bacterium]
AFAQTETDAPAARSGGVQEIEVTAQKREENLQKVPVAVTAITSEAIANARIENITDLRSIAPNLYVVQQPGGSAIPTTVMRGQVSGAASNPTVDNGISYYIDGVYLGALNGLIFDMSDIERVEIIRGPAGTLFGTNSTGGAINYITSGPKGEFGVKQDLSYARFGSFRSKTRIDTPEWNGLSASVSYLHNERKSNVRNFRQTTMDYTAFTNGELGKLTSVKRLGESTTDAVHATLRWKDVVEGLTLDYKFDWTREKSSGAPVYLIGLPDTLGGLGAYYQIAAQAAGGGLSLDDLIQTKRGKIAFNDNTTPTLTKTQSHLFVANYQANDWLSIKNSTSWRSNKRSGFTSNLDGTGFLDIAPNTQLGLLTVMCCSQLNQFSNELQLNIDTDKVTGTLGLFHYTRRTKPGSNPWGMLTNETFSAYYLGMRYAPGSSIDDFDRSFQYRVKQQAAYGQLTYHVSDQFDVTGGLRYTHDDKNFFDTSSGQPGANYNYSKGNFSYLVNLTWKPTDNTMAYAKYSTSFIAGGTAAGPMAVDPVTHLPFIAAAKTYGEEKAKSWEAGVKTELFDRRLRANLAVFHVTYTGLQTPLFKSGELVTAPSGEEVMSGASQYTTNFGKARAYGLEWEFTAVPTEGLTLGWSGSYTNFKYKKISADILAAGGVTKVSDYPVSQRPKFMTNLSAQYVMPLVDDTRLSLQLDGAYRSTINVGTQEFSNAGFVAAGLSYDPRYMNDLLKQKGLWTLNARASVMDIDVGPAKATVSLWGRNITNKQRLNFIANTSITAAGLFDDPATYGVDLSIEF